MTNEPKSTGTPISVRANRRLKNGGEEEIGNREAVRILSSGVKSERVRKPRRKLRQREYIEKAAKMHQGDAVLDSSREKESTVNGWNSKWVEENEGIASLARIAKLSGGRVFAAVKRKRCGKKAGKLDPDFANRTGEKGYRKCGSQKGRDHIRESRGGREYEDGIPGRTCEARGGQCYLRGDERPEKGRHETGVTTKSRGN